MNVYSLDHYSVPCPICHRTSGYQSVKLVRGLLTCPHCRSRFVVSFSGHYVRDPFAKRLVNGKKLRRQSRPIARIMRDAGVTRPSSMLALLGGLVVMGCTLSFLGNSGQTFSLQSVMQHFTRVSDASE